jgi:hypothetical protein
MPEEAPPAERTETMPNRDTHTVTLTAASGGLSHVVMGNVTIWFSYETAVAVQVGDAAPIVAMNEWGSTTGKHLNRISRDPARRVAHAAVLAEVARVLPRAFTHPA